MGATTTIKIRSRATRSPPKWGGFLQEIKFDATRLWHPPSSLSSIDPMQLLLLEVTRSALDDAGLNERHFERQKTSVIVSQRRSWSH